MTMNKIYAFMLSALMAIALVSCGSNDETDTPQPAPVGPKRAFTKVPKSIAGSEFKTDASGRLVGFSGGSETYAYTLDYNTKANKGKNEPDVVITQTEDGLIWTITKVFLNEKGYVKHAEMQQYDKDKKPYPPYSYDLTYNADDHIQTVIETDKNRKSITTISYKDGDIVGCTDKIGTETRTYVTHYTSKEVTTPIVNKGGLMLYDLFGVDIDELEIAYFAGMMGKPTRHLPLGYSLNGKKQNTVTWKLDKEGYPIQYKEVLHSERDHTSSVAIVWQ